MKTLTVFRLSCLCVSHFSVSVPDVRFGSAITTSEGPDLGEIKQPLESYLLSSNPETKFFEDPGSVSVSECSKLLENFGGTALGTGCDAFAYVKIHDKERI